MKSASRRATQRGLIGSALIEYDLLERGEYREAVAVLLGKANAPRFCTAADAYLLRGELLMNKSHEEARAEWQYILTLDETIPAYRVAQVQARKRLQETEPK